MFFQFHKVYFSERKHTSFVLFAHLANYAIREPLKLTKKKKNNSRVADGFDCFFFFLVKSRTFFITTNVTFQATNNCVS